MKKRHIYYLVCIIAVLLSVFFLYKLNSPRSLHQIQSSGVLRVGVKLSETDYSMHGDSVKGFQYELILALCDSLKIKPEFVVENSLENSIKALEKGKIDVIASNIPVTTDLTDRISFSIPIFNTKPVLVQRRFIYNNNINTIRNQLDLAGDSVYVPSNSPYILRINNLAKEIGDTIFVVEMPNYSTEQLIEMVAKGDIDFVVCDEQVAKTEEQLHPEIDIQTAIGFTQMQAWILPKKSRKLQEKVNYFLENFLKTKDYRDIYRKYY